MKNYIFIYWKNLWMDKIHDNSISRSQLSRYLHTHIQSYVILNLNINVTIFMKEWLTVTNNRKMNKIFGHFFILSKLKK